MKVYRIRKDYYDGDHEHGFYDLGTYASLALARESAVQWAKVWLGWVTEGKEEWKWADDTQMCLIVSYEDCWPGEECYIHIEEIEISDTPANPQKWEDAKRTVTYT